jgi:hypothetical protein
MTSTAIATPDEPHGPNSRDPKGRKSRSRKRANGEGTIYQRRDGRYEGAAFVPTTAGTVKRIRLYGRTREDVRRQLLPAESSGPRRANASTRCTC